MPKTTNPVIARTIGRKLDTLISESDTSKIEVARTLGVDPSQMTRIIQGTQYPGLELLIGFADFFNVSTDFILGREYKENKC